MRAESESERDDLDVAEETIEDLDVDDSEVQGGLTIDLTIKKTIPPRQTR